MEMADFVADKRTHFAVVRALNIIGEATKRLPPSLRDRYGVRRRSFACGSG